jgi:hypothetical protein
MTSRSAVSVLVGVLSIVGASCDRPHDHDRVPRGDGPRLGVSAIEPGSPEIAAATAGQTIYVPAYSAIATADQPLMYQLAVTLSVRNTDRNRPIVLTAAHYYHQDGRNVRDLLKTPLQIAPMAATEFFVSEADTTGGSLSSFLVEWVGDRAVSEPVVETIMVGTAGTQGVSFTCPGRVIADRGRRTESQAGQDR